MRQITEILQDLHLGQAQAATELLPLVYSELKRLAACRMQAERADHTLQPTALVHEAYLRLISGNSQQNWNSRAHFFAAAAEAMRRILVDSARSRQALRHGGDHQRREVALSELPDGPLSTLAADQNLLALHVALDQLDQSDDLAASLVKLRYFAGLSLKEAAAVLGVSPRKADMLWAYARAWLRRQLDV